MGLRAAILILFFSTSAFARQSSCLPEFTSLQVVDTSVSTHSFEYVLSSINSSGPFASKVRLSGTYDAEAQALRLNAHFDKKFDGVSLPYNLYSVLILQNGNVVGWYDFTSGCEGPGVGFYPGQDFNLPTTKLQKSSTNKLQIMVWGRL